MIFIYTTFPDGESAKKATQAILEKRLAACVNAWPISSAYVWNDAVERGNEVALIIKTTEPRFAEVEDVILRNHPHTVPCVVAFEARRINAGFKEYLMKTVR